MRLLHVDHLDRPVVSSRIMAACCLQCTLPDNAEPFSPMSVISPSGSSSRSSRKQQASMTVSYRSALNVLLKTTLSRIGSACSQGVCEAKATSRGRVTLPPSLMVSPRIESSNVVFPLPLGPETTFSPPCTKSMLISWRRKPARLLRRNVAFSSFRGPWGMTLAAWPHDKTYPASQEKWISWEQTLPWPPSC